METGGFSIERTGENGWVRLRLSGELDLATAEDLRRELLDCEDVVRSDGVKGIIVDAADLAFLDSVGLGVLIAARHQLGRQLTLIPGPPTERALRVTGTASLFDLLR